MSTWRLMWARWYRTAAPWMGPFTPDGLWPDADDDADDDSDGGSREPMVFSKLSFQSLKARSSILRHLSCTSEPEAGASSSHLRWFSLWPRCQPTLRSPDMMIMRPNRCVWTSWPWR